MSGAATITVQQGHPVREPRPERSTATKWAILGLWVAGLLLFMFVLGPMGLEHPSVKPLATFIVENDINANAYYYTEVDEFFEAERHMRDHLGYMASGEH